jgi:hypothetical protein
LLSNSGGWQTSPPERPAAARVGPEAIPKPSNSEGLKQGLRQMSMYRKAFLIWLGIMVPTVVALYWIGMTCEGCIIQDDARSKNEVGDSLVILPHGRIPLTTADE